MAVDATNKMEKHKTIKKPYTCTLEGCYKVCRDSSNLKKHLQNHRAGTAKKSGEELASKKVYKCDEPGCEEGFKLLSQLQEHKRDDHFIERPYKCDHEGCGKTYKAQKHLCRHKTWNHSSSDQHVICGEEGCGKIYGSKYVLQQHIASVHRVSDNKHTNKASDVEKKYKCDEPGCNAAFNRPYRLQNHKFAAHGGERPFKCNYEGCGKSYSNGSHLKRHKNTSHYSEIDTTKEVICDVEGCGRILSHRYNLKRHIARSHTELPFACQECKKKFKRKSQLHAHTIEEHGGEAPYKCDRCSKEFVLYNTFSVHVKKHKIHQCDCAKSFDKWSKLVEHRRTECVAKKTKYKCTICEKTFALKNALTQHSLLVHVPDSQIDFIKCPYLNCKYSYKYSGNLRYHIRTYHEKIFKEIKCTETNCEMVFKSNKNLKQHLRTVHSALSPKVRKPRRPRKDKGKPKKSMASKLSGIEVSTEENYKNITEKMDINMEQQILKVDIIRMTKPKVTKSRICGEVSATNASNDQEEGATEITFSQDVISLAAKPKDNESRVCEEVSAIDINSNLEHITEINLSEEDVTSLAAKVTVPISRTCKEVSRTIVSNNQEEEGTHVTLKNCNTTSTSVISMEIDTECSKIPNILEVGLVQPDDGVSSSEQDAKKTSDTDHIVEISSEVQSTNVNNPHTYSMQSNDEQSIVDKQVISDPIEISNDNSAMNLSMDTSTVSCGKDSDIELVIFDFPEFEIANNESEGQPDVMDSQDC